MAPCLRTWRSQGAPAPTERLRSARGDRRRAALLGLVAGHIATTGLVGFSLRRAAGAAGTTHKVLLYHFGSADELLRQALAELRHRRVRAAAQAGTSAAGTLGDRVRAVWLALREEPAPRVLDQATGLALYDPIRYGFLGRDATQQYLPALVAICPARWPDERREAVATAVLGALRGLLADLLTGDDPSRAEAGTDALCRMLDAEERRRS